jgi:hypothetical protein
MPTFRFLGLQKVISGEKCFIFLPIQECQDLYGMTEATKGIQLFCWIKKFLFFQKKFSVGSYDDKRGKLFLQPVHPDTSLLSGRTTGPAFCPHFRRQPFSSCLIVRKKVFGRD